MSSEVIENFKSICAIPHCTFETEKLREFLISYAKSKDFEIQVDEAGNIHVYKGDPKICLQSHYDMVCVGDAPNIEIVEKDGFISAKNSSLGADDGIGVAICMKMMDEFDNLEVIFTNDEEVGLQGASKFHFDIKSMRVLNLDSEEDDTVVIGCAGGVDIFAVKKLTRKKAEGKIYSVCVTGLCGGHSGLEITKDIKNSLKVICKFLKQNNARLIEFSGGERRNSIPATAKAIVLCDNDLQSDNFCKVEFLGQKECEILEQSDDILNFICSFAQGVRSYNTELALPNDSINLSLARMLDKNTLEIEFFPRAMSKDGIENMKFETKVLAQALGYEIRFENQTAPWKPEINEFSQTALNALKKYNPKAKLSAVHAGLECGVLLAKNSKLKACSIGPNIFSPHSVNEKCEVRSVEIITNTVRDIIKTYE